MDRRFFENDEEDNSSERYHRYNDEYIYSEKYMNSDNKKQSYEDSHSSENFIISEDDYEGNCQHCNSERYLTSQED